MIVYVGGFQKGFLKMTMTTKIAPNIKKVAPKEPKKVLERPQIAPKGPKSDIKLWQN